jgi:hypothetical protein
VDLESIYVLRGPDGGSTPRLTDWLPLTLTLLEESLETTVRRVRMFRVRCPPAWDCVSWKPISSAREQQWDRRQPARTWSCERGSWGIYGVGSRYQTTTGKTQQPEKTLSTCCSEPRSMWISDITIVACSCTCVYKCAINPITSPNSV